MTTGLSRTNPEALPPALRKLHGVHETPEALANFLAVALWRTWSSHPGAGAALPTNETPASPLTVLDPACGAGNLLAAMARTTPESVRGRLRLAGCERDPAAMERARQTLQGAGAATVCLRQADFLDLDANDDSEGVRGLADLVIANPPYVRTQVLGATRSRALARRFGLSGRVDLYQVFLHAIARTLRPGGRLGLITSNRFLSIRAGADVRRLLHEHFEICQLIDLGDTRLFPAAAVLPVVVVARKRAEPSASTPGTGASPFTRIYARRQETDSKSKSKSKSESHTIPAFGDLFAAIASPVTGPVAIDGRTLVIERGTLGPEADPAAPWCLTRPDSRAWLAAVALRQAGTLGDLGAIRVGIKTTADAVFLRDIDAWNRLPEALRPEPELLRPLLTHHDAGRWRQRRSTGSRPGRPGRLVLYPHGNSPEGRRQALDLDGSPRPRAYLEAHRARLESRHYLRQAGRRWYEIWVPQDPDGWSAPKIVFPDIAEEPRAFLDTTGAVVNGDCYWLAPANPDDRDRLHLAIATMNSSVVTTYYDLRFHNKLYAGRRRYITQYVASFPMPDPSHPAAARAGALAARLASEDLDPEETALLDTTCNRLVWEAFGLEPPEP